MKWVETHPIPFQFFYSSLLFCEQSREGEREKEKE